MSSHYKLLYFDLRGRGEAIRLIFRAANQKFDEVRITHAEWPQYKKGVWLLRTKVELYYE